jgi:hypothetical protein
MPNVLVRDVPEPVHTELARRARANGHSLQQYLTQQLTRLTQPGHLGRRRPAGCALFVVAMLANRCGLPVADAAFDAMPTVVAIDCQSAPSGRCLVIEGEPDGRDGARATGRCELSVAVDVGYELVEVVEQIPLVADQRLELRVEVGEVPDAARQPEDWLAYCTPEIEG